VNALRNRLTELCAEIKETKFQLYASLKRNLVNAPRYHETSGMFMRITPNRTFAGLSEH
jgi:hypothetical protein